MYCSAHTSVFYNIVILFVVNTFLLCNSSVIFLMCESAVAASYLPPSNKNEQNTARCDTVSYVNNELSSFEALKLLNEIPSIDTYQLPPIIQIVFDVQDLILSALNNPASIKHYFVCSDI